MTNNQYRIEFTSDLSRGITVTPIRFALLSNENMAHAFVIKTTRNGQKNDLTGSNVRAYFIPASQNLSVLIDGEVDQNGNAVIELTKDCYYYTGRFFLIIETETDNVTSCIFYGDGYVTKTSTDEIVAPPETVGIISAVLYNKPQSLTDAQKQQARANIGAISEIDVPQKGVHYWTPADQESIVQQVIAALGTPVFGRVDENNNIILSGELGNGAYTVKYEDADGNLIDIGALSMISYINQIAISTDTDGSIFNGTGYAVGKRLNSSGVVANVANMSAPKAAVLTGFIPVKSGDVIRFKNCYIDTNQVSSDTYGQNSWGISWWFYDASKAKVSDVVWTAAPSNTSYTAVVGSDGLVRQVTITGSDVRYVRITFAPEGDASQAIITVNQEID